MTAPANTTVPLIRPQDVQALIAQGKSIDLIDVRTPAEFDEVHAEPARLVPLDRLGADALLSSRKGAANDAVYFICRSGARAAKACELLASKGFTGATSIAGGTEGWIAAGLPVVRGTHKVISLERQVRIAAGLLVLLGVLLGWLVHPIGYGLAGFVGAGLVFAGVTDTCGMGMLLSRMPWNQRSSCTSCCKT